MEGLISTSAGWAGRKGDKRGGSLDNGWVLRLLRVGISSFLRTDEAGDRGQRRGGVMSFVTGQGPAWLSGGHEGLTVQCVVFPISSLMLSHPLLLSRDLRAYCFTWKLSFLA